MDSCYSVEKFRAAYQGEIEPLTDKTQWPIVDPGFVLLAPLPKAGAGRHRKLRIKGALEGGSGNKPKVGGKNTCKKCHELGHREAGCPYNGAKKRYSHLSNFCKICMFFQPCANKCALFSARKSRRNEAPWEAASSPRPVTRR